MPRCTAASTSTPRRPSRSSSPPPSTASPGSIVAASTGAGHAVPRSLLPCVAWSSSRLSSTVGCMDLLRSPRAISSRPRARTRRSRPAHSRSSHRERWLRPPTRLNRICRIGRGSTSCPRFIPTMARLAGFLVLDASVPSLPVTPRRLHAVALGALHHGYGIRSASDGIVAPATRTVQAHASSCVLLVHVSTSDPSTGLDVRWGALHLTAAVVHPRSGGTNRARPAIGLETYWRVAGRLPSRHAHRLPPQSRLPRQPPGLHCELVERNR